MATDSPVPQPEALPVTPALITVASTSNNQLRRHLRSRLERHVCTENFRPALTIVGVQCDVVDVLHHGTGRPENALLELVLPSKYSAIGVLASSVISTPPGRAHSDAALAVGVPRSGSVVSLLATNDTIVDTKEPQGWLIDACCTICAASHSALSDPGTRVPDSALARPADGRYFEHTGKRINQLGPPQ